MKTITYIFFSLLVVQLTHIFAQNTPEFHNSTQHLERNAPYSEAVSYGGLIYVSGQVGLLPDGTLVRGGIVEETKLAMTRIKKILNNNGSNMEKVIKCNCILADIKDFQKMSDTYRAFFSKDKLPARTTFAGTVALGGRIEIDCVAAKE